MTTESHSSSPSPLRFVPISSIVVGNRQRKKMLWKDTSELQQSIVRVGLINPILVSFGSEPGTYNLVAGGRRLKAIDTYFNVPGRSLTFAGEPFTTASLPVIALAEEDIILLKELEYDENVIRLDIDWKDQCEALQEIEELRKERDPNYTRKELAEELHVRMGGEESGHTVGSLQAKLTRSITVAEALPKRPDLQKAKSAHEAYRILIQEQHEKFNAELTRRKLAQVAEVERLWDIRLGDLKTLMVEMPDAEVDLVLTDPPYGQEAHTEKYSAGNFHRYDDSDSYARDLSIFIIQESWRVTKSKANLFMFCKWETFPLLRDAAAQYGWKPWYHPIFWYKGSAEGFAPWGRLGFFRTYECIFWATKGEKGLVRGPIPDILDFAKVHNQHRIHAAEKPIRLLRRIIDTATDVNDLILDPCAGSGSTLVAATEKHRRALGFELDETYYNRAMTRLAEVEPDG